jgi:uncharacterized protein YukE
MDGLELINRLEGLRNVVPSELQHGYDDLINNVRRIYEASIQVIAPSDIVHDGKQNLSAHYTTLDDLHKELSNNMAAFQTVYKGPGSDTYHQTTTAALGDMAKLNDHINLATQIHQNMYTNFDIANAALAALTIAVGAIVFEGGTFLFSGGAAAPIDIPAMIGTALAAIAEVVSIDTAIAVITGLVATLAEAVMAALPGLLVLGTASVVGGLLLSGDTTTLQAQAITRPVPIDWAGDSILKPWADKIRKALAKKGLTDAQILQALALAAATAKAMECNGFTQQEINTLLANWGDWYDPNSQDFKTPGKNSFGYGIELLIRKVFGFDISTKITPPNNIPDSDITGARRIIRSVISPTAEDATGRPVSPFLMTGGPTNVIFSSPVYQDQFGNLQTQVEYNKELATDPASAKLWTRIGSKSADVDIVKNDGSMHIEVGGANKSDVAKLNNQIDRLLQLPGGATTAYVFLERPPAGSPASMTANFDQAIATASAKLDPSHIIILDSPDPSCSPTSTP